MILSYTNLGYALRSRRWDASDLAPMDGKVVLVTGATSGLGEAAATAFARLGASVWLVARNRERGEDTRARIAQQTGSDDVHVGICDLSDLRSVRRFAEQCEAGAGRLDVLVNNAGVLTEERSLSRDGIELTLATNVVGPFLLTKLLVPLLLRSAPARVINVSSGGMYTQGLHLDDLESARGKFRGTVAYARSKRIEVVLSELWASQLEGTGVVVNSMHPGWVDTPGLR
ncbi:MAG: SDR family NAD(P)-dependent oxidoreductase, partial [Solirubrobacteraceae bacterium]